MHTFSAISKHAIYKCVRKHKLYANIEFIAVKRSYGMRYILHTKCLNVLDCQYKYGSYSLLILAQFVGSLSIIICSDKSSKKQIKYDIIKKGIHLASHTEWILLSLLLALTDDSALKKSILTF